MAAMRDIYNRQIDLGAPMSADAIRVLISKYFEEDMMMQSVNFRYQQAVTRLWELGSFKTFMFAGRTEGDIQAKRVIGAKSIALSFVKEYGDVCNMMKNHLTLKIEPGCTSQGEYGTASITARGCVVNSVSYAVQAQDKIINEDMAIMFVALTDKAA